MHGSLLPRGLTIPLNGGLVAAIWLLACPSVRAADESTPAAAAGSQISAGTDSLDAKSQYEQGLRWLESGDAGEVERGIQLVTRAAEQGYTDAEFLVGLVHEKAKSALALEWYQQAATKGHAEAQSKLGNAYSQGRLLEANYQEAVRWHKLAAGQGITHSRQALKAIAKAQFDKGMEYLHSYKPDLFAEGTRLVTQAAENGHVEAQYFVGLVREKEGDSQMTVWYRKAAEQGHVKAQSKLGALYQAGTNVESDPAESWKWHRRAASRGSAPSELALGLLYQSGRGVPQDFRQAAIHFRRAAEQGNLEAQKQLGLLYHAGQGVPQDFVEAYFWLNLAAAQGASPEPRDEVRKQMSAEQLAEGQRRAAAFRPAALLSKAAEKTP